jgi:four helix bundle protein
MGTKIQNFTDLNTWKEAHKLVLEIYKITKTFPKSEIYGLTSQMRRCAVSITSNIAEGFSRRGKKEKIQFYYMAKGSLTELHNQLIVSKDVGYITNSRYGKIVEFVDMVGRLLTGLIRSVQGK